LIQNSEIDFILEKEKIEEIRKEVGLTSEQTQDIILQLIREQKEESLKQERDQYAYCPHCGKKLPE
jgi:voltage-gated potassium channel